MPRIVVGITGATGAPLAVRILKFLQEMEVEVHLVVSQWARTTLQTECGLSLKDIAAYAAQVHDARDQGASISSGSFRHDGMLIVPCSMKTLAAIRAGYADNLIARAADVTLKERRKLVLVAREAPLNSIHLENMLSLSNLGAVIFPPSPAFYNQPQTLDDILDHMAVRVLDQFNLDHPAAKRWYGMQHNQQQE